MDSSFDPPNEVLQKIFGYILDFGWQNLYKIETRFKEMETERRKSPRNLKDYENDGLFI